MIYYFKHKSLPIWMHITENEVMSIQADCDKHLQEFIIQRENIDAYTPNRMAEMLGDYDACDFKVWADAVAMARNKLQHMLLPTSKTVLLFCLSLLFLY